MHNSTPALERGRPGPRAVPLRVLRDERLAELVTRGDDRAFEEIYRRHHQAIYRYCRSILHQDQDAQDALQTTMVGALRRLRTEARDAPVRPWLFRIAHNESVTLVRRRRPCEPLDHRLAVAGPSLESRLEDRRRLGLLVADLGRLPDRQRAALVMRELSDLSHEEIGYALELPVSGVKQAIFDARKGLQEFEAGRAMNCDVVQRAISDCDGRALRARRLRAHLEACADCASWRDAIGSRRQMLGSLVAPIGPGSAVAILARITHLMDTGGGGVAAAVAKAAAGTAAGKAVLGAALVAVTAGGMAEVHRAQAHPAAGSAGRPTLAARPAARRPATSTFTAQPPKLATRQRLGPHDNRLQPATPAPGDPGAGVQPDASGPKVSPVAGSPSTDGSDHGKGPNGAGPPGLLKQSTAAPSSKHGKSTKGIAAPGQLKKSTAAPSTKHGKSTNGTGAPGRLKKQKAGSPSSPPAPPPGNAPSAGAPPGQTKKADATQPSPTPPPGNGPPAGGPPGQADKGGTSESSSDQSSSNAQPNGGQHGSSQGQGQGQGNKSGK